jgi:hypothetical protein
MCSTDSNERGLTFVFNPNTKNSAVRDEENNNFINKTG